MITNISKDRFIKNEQIVRDQNVLAEKSIKKYFRNQKEIKESPIAFICECSNIDCGEHVCTSIDSYEKLHKRKDCFTVFRGHLTPAVERIVGQQQDFDIVEKLDLSAS